MPIFGKCCSYFVSESPLTPVLGRFFSFLERFYNRISISAEIASNQQKTRISKGIGNFFLGKSVAKTKSIRFHKTSYKEGQDLLKLSCNYESSDTDTDANIDTSSDSDSD